MSEFVGYDIQAYWGARCEEPAGLGRRYWEMLQTLSVVDPAFNSWRFIGTSRFWPLPSGPGEELTRLIADGVATAGDGDPTPIYGYRFGASTRAGSKSSLTIDVHAGNYTPNLQYYTNTAGLMTKPVNEENIDLITLPIFKAALLAIAEAWDATW